MTDDPTLDAGGALYRVDRFALATEARDELLAKINATQALLRTLPGCTQELVLEQPAAYGRVKLLTIVGWASEAHMREARRHVAELHERMGFVPQELFRRLAVDVEMAVYHQATP